MIAAAALVRVLSVAAATVVAGVSVSPLCGSKATRRSVSVETVSVCFEIRLETVAVRACIPTSRLLKAVESTAGAGAGGAATAGAAAAVAAGAAAAAAARAGAGAGAGAGCRTGADAGAAGALAAIIASAPAISR